MTWEQFFDWLMRWEGRVVHRDPRDPGGQTAWGISRRHHPAWAGWELVDAGTTSGPAFERLVSDFYRAQYGHEWESLPPRVNAAFCDAAINMGTVYAAQCLQDALNRLAGTTYVLVDGRIGPRTREAVRHADADGVAFTMCAIRLAEYCRRGRKCEARRVFLDGWASRVRSLMEEI